MGELAKLPNIGKELERQLEEAGITTADQLRSLGSRKAWLKLREQDPTACLHRLTALEGAIQGIRKNLLTPSDKSALKEFFDVYR